MARNEQLMRLAQILNELESQGTMQQDEVKDMLEAFRTLNSTDSKSKRRRAMARINRGLGRFVLFGKKK